MFKGLMKLLLEENEEFDEIIDEACMVGAALSTTAIQCIVARTLICNPEIFGERTAATDGSDRQFQHDRDMVFPEELPD